MNLQDITYGFSGDAVLAEEALSAVQYLWQSILNSLSGSKKGEKPDPECLKINKSIIDSLLTTMTMSLNSRSITGEARDMILQIFTKNIGIKIYIFLYVWTKLCIIVGNTMLFCRLCKS